MSVAPGYDYNVDLTGKGEGVKLMRTTTLQSNLGLING